MEAQAVPGSLTPRDSRLGNQQGGVDATVAFTNGPDQTFIYLERYIVDTMFGHFYRGVQHGIEGRPQPDERDEQRLRGVKCVYIHKYNTRNDNSGAEDPDNEINISRYIEERSTYQTAFDHHVILPRRVITNRMQTNLVHRGEQYYFIISPYGGGDLFEQLREGTLVDQEALMRTYWRQIIQGVQYLHNLRIFHADLKPENLVTRNEQNAFIIDFGQAQVIPDGVDQITNQGRGYGTRLYAAPEFVTSMVIDWRKADVWALGVSFFILLLGVYPPWSRHDNDGQVRVVNVHNPHFLNICRHGNLAQHTQESNISDAAVDLLQSMLFENVAERISIDEILAHPWMQN